MASWFIWTFLVLRISTCLATNIQCLDKNGKPVDWYIIYKLPQIDESKNPIIQKGLAFFYMDVNTQSWSLSNVSLNASNHAIYYTLQQIYNNQQSQTAAYVMYNDEKPRGPTTESFGHAKGDIGFDFVSGFWLIHSVPKFPPPEKYDYPESGTRFGQSFLCISLPYSQLNLIGEQLMYNEPWIYSQNLPSKFQTENPNFASVVAKKHVKSPPWNNTLTLKTTDGQKFISFAKYKKFGKDLYSAFVAPYFGISLRTETWLNGRGSLPSFCGGNNKVENIKEILFNDDVKFKNSKDHSKWAVSQTTQPWTCIGDINRQTGQFKRSGGTLCFNSIPVYKAFNNVIREVEKCPNNV